MKLNKQNWPAKSFFASAFFQIINFGLKLSCLWSKKPQKKFFSYAGKVIYIIMSLLIAVGVGVGDF